MSLTVDSTVRPGIADLLEGALLPLVGAGQPVPTVHGGAVPYVNLDVAASAPALVSVWEAVGDLLPWYSSVHRGAGFLSQLSTGVLESARQTVADFVGAPAGSGVVFTRNTTDALNLLAAALPVGTSIVTYASEHHANLLPWRRLGAVELPVPESPRQAVEWAAATLRELPAGPRLLAVTGASNVTGEIWPVSELVEVAHAYGARVVVDAAQLAPHRAVDLAALGADYLALSGHKLYAPFGTGALIGRSDWLDTAAPYLHGGGAVVEVTTDEVTWATGPARHEAGTPNLVGAAALASACTALATVGMNEVRRHEAVLLDRLLDGLAALPAATVYSAWSPGCDRLGVVSFNLEGISDVKLATVLSAEHGVGVRHGSFCAHPLVEHLTGHGRAQRGAVRASLGVGSTAEDVDRLLSALKEIACAGPRWSYRLTDAGFVPDPDPRPAPRVANLWG
jgi:selenocysteine lyase/cysteine desulfurase